MFRRSLSSLCSIPRLVENEKRVLTSRDNGEALTKEVGLLGRAGKWGACTDNHRLGRRLVRRLVAQQPCIQGGTSREEIIQKILVHGTLHSSGNDLKIVLYRSDLSTSAPARSYNSLEHDVTTFR